MKVGKKRMLSDITKDHIKDEGPAEPPISSLFKGFSNSQPLGFSNKIGQQPFFMKVLAEKV